MRDSCLSHRKKGRYITLRHEYLQLCDYDFCAATLVSVFENWTNWMISLSDSEKFQYTDLPYVTISYRRLRSDTLGSYSRATIAKAMNSLIDQKVVKVITPPHDKQAGVYLLNCDLINSLCSEFTEEEIPDAFPSYPDDPMSERPTLATPQNEARIDHSSGHSWPHVRPELTTQVAIVGHSYKEESELEQSELKVNKKSEYARSDSASLSLDSEAPFDLDDFKLFWRHRKGFKKLKTAEIERAEKELCNSKYNNSQILDAVSAYANDDFWKGKGFPLAGFLSRLDRFVDTSGGGSTALPSAALPGSPVRHPAISLPAPVVEFIGSVLPARVEEWNQIAPERLRIAMWTNHDPTRELLDADNDPVFRQNFPEICRKCIEIGEGRVKTTFQWLFFLAKNKKPNWYQVYSGAYNWALAVDATAVVPGKVPSPADVGRNMLAKLEAKMARESSGNGI